MLKIKQRIQKIDRFPRDKQLEAIGVDVVKTANKVGLKLQFPVERDFYRVGLLMVG